MITRRRSRSFGMTPVSSFGFDRTLPSNIRDQVRRKTSFTLQEVYFLWTAFCDLSKSERLSHAEYASFIQGFGLPVSANQWLLPMMDMDQDGSVNFDDWCSCADRAVRGTCSQRLMMAFQALCKDNTSLLGVNPELEPDVVLSRLSQIAEWSSTLTEQQVNQDVESLFSRLDQGALHVDEFMMYGASLPSIQELIHVVMIIFTPTIISMQAKLKRTTTLNLSTVCLQEKKRVPRAMSMILQELRERVELQPKMAEFEPTQMRSQRSMIEAISNMFLQELHDYADFTGVSGAVLLMVLRTYLRHFTEPFLTLHWSRRLDSMFLDGESEMSDAVDFVKTVLPLLPPDDGMCLHALLSVCNILATTEKAVKSLARVLAYCVIRPESKCASTSKSSIALFEVMIKRWKTDFEPLMKVNSQAI